MTTRSKKNFCARPWRSTNEREYTSQAPDMGRRRTRPNERAALALGNSRFLTPHSRPRKNSACPKAKHSHGCPRLINRSDESTLCVQETAIDDSTARETLRARSQDDATRIGADMRARIRNVTRGCSPSNSSRGAVVVERNSRRAMALDDRVGVIHHSHAAFTQSPSSARASDGSSRATIQKQPRKQHPMLMWRSVRSGQNCELGEC